MKIVINKDKRIGEVIFVVEGRDDEPQIIKNIFSKVFNYSVYRTNKNGDIIELRTSSQKYNKVIIVVNNKPQIATINTDTYLDDVYKKLISNNFDPYNAATYFIFDRDYGSNDYKEIDKLMGKLVNSRENPNFELNGLLLLSYPCIQAFYCNCHNVSNEFSNGKEIKKYVNMNGIKYVNEREIECATKVFLSTLKTNFNIDFEVSMLDDFYDENKKILKEEDEKYFNEQKFITLSCFVLSLLDLGIVEFEY